MWQRVAQQQQQAQAAQPAASPTQPDPHVSSQLASLEVNQNFTNIQSD